MTTNYYYLEGIEFRCVNNAGISYGPWMDATDEANALVHAEVMNAIADEIAEDTGVNVVTVGGNTYKFRHVDDAE